MVMTLYSSMASEENELQNLPVVTAVLTSMAGGSVITSEAEDYSTSDDLMDISSYSSNSLVNTTHQNAIPTSVITPTTSLANGWLGLNGNVHGGFVPPPVSSTTDGYVTGVPRSAIPTSAIRSVPHHQQRVIIHRQAERMHPSEIDVLRMSPSNSRRRIRDDELAPDEREKRKVRRERNKLAAAKCRQRRVDHTNSLVQETEEWEEKNSSLEQEIQKLQQQKEQLQFILEAHRAMCKRNKVNKETTTCSTSTSTRKTMTLDTPSTEVVTPTSMFKFVGQEAFASDAMTSDGLSSPTCGQEVKRESTSSSDLSSPEGNRTLIEL